MAGGNIYCGTFKGNDKSGSAYEGVLDAIGSRANCDAQKTLRQLKEAVKRVKEYVEITGPQATTIEPLLAEYEKELIRLIGHDDWLKAAQEEETAGLDSVAGKWGKGKGWQLYCVRDLITACKVAGAEKQSIYIAFS